MVRQSLTFLASAAVMAAVATPAIAQKKETKPAAKSTTKPAAKPATPSKSTEPPLPEGSGTPQVPGTTVQRAVPAAQAGAKPKTESLMKVITVREKSDKAGEVFRAFLEGTSDRSKLVLDTAKNGPKVTEYFATSPNKEFKVLAVQIQGSVAQPKSPDRVIFPYFVATDKNRMGFLCAVMETSDGFKVDWESFATGHDMNLEKFLRDKPPGPVRVLVGIAKSHLFGTPPPGGEAKWGVYSIEMPEPPLDMAEKPIFFADKASEAGKLLGSKLGWSKGHLCYVTLTHEGQQMFCRKYEPYAK